MWPIEIETHIFDTLLIYAHVENILKTSAWLPEIKCREKTTLKRRMMKKRKTENNVQWKTKYKILVQMRMQTGALVFCYVILLSYRVSAHTHSETDLYVQNLLVCVFAWFRACPSIDQFQVSLCFALLDSFSYIHICSMLARLVSIKQKINANIWFRNTFSTCMCVCVLCCYDVPAAVH